MPPDRLRGKVTVVLSGFSSWEILWSFLPGGWQARLCARAIVKDYNGKLPEKGIVLQIPDGRWYEILDVNGRVRET